MNRFRELTLVSPLDGLRLAARFPRTAYHILRDSASAPGPTDFPRRLGLFLTDRCDFACPMCAVLDARNAGGGDLRFKIVERVLEECSRHQPVVDLIGGEPLLYPLLAEAVKLASRLRVLAVVTTNGLKLAQNAEALVRADLPLLQVSLDGWDEDSQKARGGVKGSFDRLREGIRAVVEARGKRAFPIIRILTAITRVNHARLDRIQEAIAAMGLRNWGISNYFYLNRVAHERHQVFALIHGLSGAVTAHTIAEDVYLTRNQVQDLKASLRSIKDANRKLGLRIAYAWNVDVDAYYSIRQASRASRCELPYSRLDIHTDGHMAVCVSGKKIGKVGEDSIADVWSGTRLAQYRTMYEHTRPMPMCFRCCGLSQSIKVDSH